MRAVWACGWMHRVGYQEFPAWENGMFDTYTLRSWLGECGALTLTASGVLQRKLCCHSSQNANVLVTLGLQDRKEFEWTVFRDKLCLIWSADLAWLGVLVVSSGFSGVHFNKNKTSEKITPMSVLNGVYQAIFLYLLPIFNIVSKSVSEDLGKTTDSLDELRHNRF